MEMDGAGAGGGLRARNELARFSSFFFVYGPVHRGHWFRLAGWLAVHDLRCSLVCLNNSPPVVPM